MIFAIPGHISMIRNGLFWYDGIDKPDYSLEAMKEFSVQRTQFCANRSDLSKEVKKGIHPLIIKTQTRRLNRGIYKVGKDYAVQSKRGVKAEPDIRIVMDRIWGESVAEFHREDSTVYPIPISKEDAWAEGGYTPAEYEEIYLPFKPKQNRFRRWVFEFHVIERR